MKNRTQYLKWGQTVRNAVSPHFRYCVRFFMHTTPFPVLLPLS